jgi:hypothetical protein
MQAQLILLAVLGFIITLIAGVALLYAALRLFQPWFSGIPIFYSPGSLTTFFS